MKNRVLLIFASFALLIASIGFFSWEKQQYSAPTPEPSLRGGYYAAPFTLELRTPGRGTIYYTTDGSTPTTDSQVYADGILIEDRSEEPDLYNAVSNVVLNPDRFEPGSHAEKGTVVRAVFVNEKGVVSEIMTQTYFVGIRPPERGYTLSLVFDFDDLFGEDGIHVTGREYDAWLQSGEGDAPPANFQKDLEAAATAEFMDASGDVLNQRIGLSLQGASSRELPKKRFTLTARAQYSGSDVFGAPLFDGVTSHSVMIKGALPDAVISELVSDRAAAYQRSAPVRVYLNGEFWYDSFLLERYDQQYFRQHYGVDDRIRAKNGELDEETAATDLRYCYAEFMGWVGDTDFSDPDALAQAGEMADIQSFIDYVVTNYYLANADLDDYKNYVLWRSPHPGPGAFQDARWRWCIFDVDVIENIWVNYADDAGIAQLNTFSSDRSHELNDLTLLKALRVNPDFQKQFVLSFMDMVNNNFAPARVEKVLQNYGCDLSWMDGFFEKRPSYAVQHLAEEFGLTGTLETVTVSCEDPEMGAVTVNTSVIDLSTGTWSGQYFTDYPITVTAAPKPGYRFVGWKGGSAETALTLSAEGGITLEAVFAEK